MHWFEKFSNRSAKFFISFENAASVSLAMQWILLPPLARIFLIRVLSMTDPQMPMSTTFRYAILYFHKNCTWGRFLENEKKKSSWPRSFFHSNLIIHSPATKKRTTRGSFGWFFIAFFLAVSDVFFTRLTYLVAHITRFSFDSLVLLDYSMKPKKSLAQNKFYGIILIDF